MLLWEQIHVFSFHKGCYLEQEEQEKARKSGLLYLLCYPLDVNQLVKVILILIAIKLIKYKIIQLNNLIKARIISPLKYFL